MEGGLKDLLEGLCAKALEAFERLASDCDDSVKIPYWDFHVLNKKCKKKCFLGPQGAPRAPVGPPEPP